ncbi:MAG: DUF3300 domain-containing protein [bacterium]
MKMEFGQATVMLCLASGVCAFSSLADGQPPPVQNQNLQQGGFSKARIEQLVAPVALYPDALLAQVLMASTYPSEIAQAAYWLQGNPDLVPSEMSLEMQSKPWDPSVKALVAYAGVLYRMNGDIAWTRDLGDAVLGQQKEVLDTVQRLRAKAQAAGNLSSGKDQTVSAQPDDIQIQPAIQDQVYVPAYNPATVYGSGWGYPVRNYPGIYNNYDSAFYYHNYGLYGNCSWGNRNLYLDRNAYARLYNSDQQLQRSVNTAHQTWQHDPDHRQGVPYYNQAIENKYAAQLESERNNRQSFKAYSPVVATMPAARAISPTTQRAGGNEPAAVQHLEGQAASARQENMQAAAVAAHLDIQRELARQEAYRINAFSGFSNPASDDAYRNRGNYSRSTGRVYYGGGAGHYGTAGKHR